MCSRLILLRSITCVLSSCEIIPISSSTTDAIAAANLSESPWRLQTSKREGRDNLICFEVFSSIAGHFEILGVAEMTESRGTASVRFELCLLSVHSFDLPGDCAPLLVPYLHWQTDTSNSLASLTLQS